MDETRLQYKYIRMMQSSSIFTEDTSITWKCLEYTRTSAKDRHTTVRGLVANKYVTWVTWYEIPCEVSTNVVNLFKHTVRWNLNILGGRAVTINACT